MPRRRDDDRREVHVYHHRAGERPPTPKPRGAAETVLGCGFLLFLSVCVCSGIALRRPARITEEPEARQIQADRPQEPAESPKHPPEPAPAPPAKQQEPPPEPPPPPPAPKLVPIPSMPVTQAWREAAALVGRRVRLTGEAEVKRSEHGVYAVLNSPTGLRLATVTVRNADAEPLREIAIGQAVVRRVNLETTVKGGSGGQMVLADSEFLPLDAPPGFVAAEPPPDDSSSPSLATTPTPTTAGASAAAPASSTMIGGSGPVNVRGYYRHDGTYVRGYTRSMPGMGGGRRR